MMRRTLPTNKVNQGNRKFYPDNRVLICECPGSVCQRLYFACERPCLAFGLASPKANMDVQGMNLQCKA